MSDVDLPVAHVRAQVASAIDLVVHTARLRDAGGSVFQIAVGFRSSHGLYPSAKSQSTAVGGVEMTAHAYALLDSYIYGFALQEASLPFQGPESASEVAEPMMQQSRQTPARTSSRWRPNTSSNPATTSATSSSSGSDVILRAPHPDDSQRRHWRCGAALARRAGGFEKGEHCHDPAIHLPFLDDAQLLLSTQRAVLPPAGLLNGLTGGQSEQRSHCRVPDPCGHGVAGRTGRQRTLQGSLPWHTSSRQ